ncbi:MAG TPA: aldose epimerase family protein [Sphaerochaeta sp.]|nr:aldose epimerase family protein [Sphaerochaeta sp.]
MIDVKILGKTAAGENIQRITLERGPFRAQLLNLGANLQTLEVPDAQGQRHDIVLGFSDPLQNLSSTTYFGQTVGRYANRIAGGTFVLDEKEYQLQQNEGNNTLHSASANWGHKPWVSETFSLDGNPGVVFSYYSPDGEGGFPAAVNATVSYLLSDDGSLTIDYEVTATAPTVLNLTNHSYFNLAGAGSGSIANHLMQLFCDHYLPVDAELIPTGEVLSVADTPFDFQQPKLIGKDLEAAGGYDHCFIQKRAGEGLEPLAIVSEEKSGRVMEVASTLPAVQFYSGNFLDGSEVGKGGAAYKQHGGFCLETQYYPNSVNEPAFPSTVFTPERPYRHSTRFSFSVRR